MTKPMFHEATVTGRHLLTSGMVRLTFSGDGLAAFRSTGIADEYIRLFFPDPETGELALPTIDADGRWTFPDSGPPVRYATYTVRQFDAERCELVVDFVVHEGGLASDWAQNASLGDRILINNPRGLYKPPEDLRWQILLADATGLPAVARIIEQTPCHVASRVFIEVADEAHRQPLPEHPRARVTWLTGTGNGVAPSLLSDLIGQVPLLEGGGYLWGAGEQRSVRALRRFASETSVFGDGRHKLVAYWIAEEAVEDGGQRTRLPEEVSADWSQ
ncbi:MAG TPA: siderophore-interacting protein [Bosea sp. (in: a-proteobacteria)]|jgi:NADPH-dependent ferric siderophore reductase|uniref:siderophore-interacting protein n=1 Tax=Bosea sp. (in: a-proteobacteria) TaxID=1871050 RepID=UPI002E15E1C1|nr:siderophore-interacting protein [Bosea sp. (in: a-proteobacteria)]